MERISDIVMLVKHFLQKYGQGRRITIPTETIRKLKKYNWPGNVRELENTIHLFSVHPHEFFRSVE